MVDIKTKILGLVDTQPNCAVYETVSFFKVDDIRYIHSGSIREAEIKDFFKFIINHEKLNFLAEKDKVFDSINDAHDYIRANHYFYNMLNFAKNAKNTKKHRDNYIKIFEDIKILIKHTNIHGILSEIPDFEKYSSFLDMDPEEVYTAMVDTGLIEKI